MDALRGATIVGVILVHAAGTYAADVGWYLREPGASTLLTALLSVPASVGLIFGLGPLFLLAGLTSGESLRRHGRAVFLRRRLWRLAVPLLIFVVTLGPASTALAAAATDGSGWWSSFGHALRRPDLGPMWFVGVLIVATVGLTIRGPRSETTEAPGGGSAMLVRWALVIAVADFFVWLQWSYVTPVGSNLNLAHWPQSLGLFALGVAAAGHQWSDHTAGRLRRLAGRMAIAGAGALLTLVVVVYLTVDQPSRLAGGLHIVTIVFAACDGVVAVGSAWWVVAAFRSSRMLDRELVRRAIRATRGSYGAYIVHPPILVGLAVGLMGLPWPAGVKLVVVAVVGTTASFVVGGLLRRGAARPPWLHPGQEGPVQDQTPHPNETATLGPSKQTGTGRGLRHGFHGGW